jgi:hypothetical protein
MTISAEHFLDMDASLQARQQQASREIQDSINTGELFETHDIQAGLRIGKLAGTYVQLVAGEHDTSDPALHQGVEKGLIAGWHLGSIIMDKTVEQSQQDLRGLPTSPDRTDLASMCAWASRQVQTSKLAMEISEQIALREGDTSLTGRIAMAVGLAFYHTVHQQPTELPTAS